MASSGSPKDFAMRLFSDEPQAPKTIPTFFAIDEDDDCAIFEILLIIFTEGLKLWYSTPIVISNITPQDFIKLQTYFHSFGYNVTLNIANVTQYTRVNNKSYNNETKLENMKFQMIEETKLYTIQFSKLP